MKEVLVLGGSYFIGKRLVEILNQSEEKFNISVLNRASKKMKTESLIKNIEADRNNEEIIIQKLKGKKYDIVFDISGLEKQQVKNIIQTITPENIGVYVFLSSSAVYSDKEKRPFSENTAIGLNSVWGQYGLDKIDCETYLQDIYKNRNMAFCIVRPPYVYGKWNYIYRESYCFERAENNNSIIIPGSGEQKIQFISVDDLCYTLLELAKNSKAYNDIYNVGKEILTFKEWAKMCVDATKKSIRNNHF